MQTKKNCYQSTCKSNITEKAGRYLLASIICCGFCVVPAIAEASTNYWAPWATKTTTNSATINWRGESNGVGQVDYATADYYNQYHSFNNTVDAQTPAQHQHVQLAGLAPDTAYIYRVKPSGHADEFSNRTFRTMPISGPFTFIVISDSQEGHHYTEEQRFKYVADAVAKETNILFILHGGDNAGFDDELLWTTYFHVADGMLAQSAIFPVIGNHEYHDPNGETNPPTAANQYHWAYDMPLTYSFDCANVRFVILNSPDPTNAASGSDDPPTSTALAKGQAPWLKEQLNNTLAGTFTIHHHPIWADGRTNINSHLESWEILYHTYNISANFAGHVHNYQRFLVEGIPYFIGGIGGGRCADITGPDPAWYQFGETRKLGYIKVFVDPQNNTAIAQEIVAASITNNDDGEIPVVYDPPLINDTTAFFLKTQTTQTFTGPVIKANGSTNDITIANGAELAVTVQMNPGEFTGIEVDWWVVARAGSSWYYLSNLMQWTPFDGDLANCQPVHQGPLFTLPPLEVLNTSGLPPGPYTFWFAVDYPMDGTLHLEGPILVDAVSVTIQSE